MLAREATPRQLLAFDSAIDAVVEGRPGVVLIEGSAGYGKSRLLEEVVRRARVAGVTALRSNNPSLYEARRFSSPKRE